MSSHYNQFEALRVVLENLLQPQRLDAHPWTKSLIVLQANKDIPALLDKSPGQQLVAAISAIFARMMPTTPPRRGKRLDTAWGEFGILAALYFAPFSFGEPSPNSLRDAWGHIDQSILLFVYGKSRVVLTEAEKETYKLVGNEPDIAPISTLSDWHQKGLRRLAELILARENYLSESFSKPAVISHSAQAARGSPHVSAQKNSKAHEPQLSKIRRQRFVNLFLGVLMFGILSLGGFMGWKIYQQINLVRQDAIQVRDLATGSGSALERLSAVGPSLSKMSQDFEVLKNETQPFLWMGAWLKWMPIYGGDLASARDLITIADSMLSCSNITYQAISPLLGEGNLSNLSPTGLTELLLQVQPQLLEAQQQIESAAAARQRVTPENLSPGVRDLILNEVDPLLTLMQDGLTVAEAFPSMMGATNEGPKTYMLLVENEDELRPTGGFITAVGTLLMQDGHITSLTFDNVEDLDDWSKPYPAAPWQLQQYMNSPVLILRDTNWFTNFPTAALYAEQLYSYVRAHSVDGVIAFDQRALVDLLDMTGPINLEGVPYAVNSTNVIAYMQASKIPSLEERNQSGRVNKDFLKQIADALLAKIYSGDIPPERIFTFLLQVLNEHHLLLQFDDPSITSVLARRHWDGAVHSDGGDFLMVVDTNIGFNKTNAVVKSQQSYDVDLTDPSSPIASLTILHTNNAAEIICKQWDKIRVTGEEFYPITDCYWNYLRVYMPKGTELLDSGTQFVPANWLILKQDVPAHVDILDEGLEGIQAFGTLQVVPGSETLTTSFRFALPASVLKVGPDHNQFSYSLRVQKQPGTLAMPITIRVHLPNNASVLSTPAGAVVQDRSILYQTDLRTDLEFEIDFQIP